ncbi:Diphthine--ammonia ligase [Stylophora pistillata]|uniref:Diphthine--ammonia ligase n=1 Tax=Stylophora pistillata TaxID=50429 RepID=A0A2B4RWL1_STYPI|nr:Diphthine--ammonia ligase [Stylophora pistillata]
MMRVVALISGGKDSCYNMMQCVQQGHTIIALANLKPRGDADELDSYMYQTVGHNAIDLYAQAMDLPLYRGTIEGSSVDQGKVYTESQGDEVEDLYKLLKNIKEKIEFDAVSTGAILSDYQRVRVEHVCSRLGLSSLAYLWRRDQTELLGEMISSGVEAILIKVAAMDLSPKRHLGLPIADVYSLMCNLKDKYGSNVCGEGGEYETFTLDCPLFKKRIVIEESESVIHSDDAFAPVGFLCFKKIHVEDKDIDKVNSELGLKNHKCEELFDKLQILPDNTTDIKEKGIAERPLNIKIPKIQPELGKELRGRILYSRCGDYIWLSGIYGSCDNEGKKLAIEDVTRKVFQSLKDTLTSLKASLSDGVMVHLFVKNMDDFAKVNSVYKSFLSVNPPARACIQLNLPEDVSIQVDCLVYAAEGASNSMREAMHVQSISHWAPANIGPYSQATKFDISHMGDAMAGKMVRDTIFISGSIGLWPPTMSMVTGGISMEAPLSLQHVDRILTALNVAKSLQNVVHGFCFLTSSVFVPVAKNAWSHALKDKEGLLLVQDNSTLADRGSFSVHVQSIAVKGNINSSFAVNIAVESTSTNFTLEEVMVTFISEIKCYTSQHYFSLSHLMYLRIFYVKGIMDHWNAQDFIHRSLERNTLLVPTFSLIPVDALEKNTVMLFCCFLQKAENESLVD